MGEVLIRPWQVGDYPRLVAAGRLLSARTLAHRFNTGTAGLPPGYLKLFRRSAGLVQVAVYHGRIIGWAEARPGGTAWEIAVLVTDDWQNRGIGSVLVYALLEQCRVAGVAAVYADIAPDNAAARALRESALRAGIPFPERRLVSAAA